MKTSELYSSSELLRLKKQNGIIKICLAVFCLAAFGICLFLFLTVNTKNEKRNEYSALAVNGICGTGAVIVYMCAVSPRDREIAHVEHMLEGEREEFAYDAPLSVGEKAFYVPRSIAVRTVRAKSGDTSSVFHISDRLAGSLKGAPEQGVLYVVNGYIAAYTDESDVMRE